MIRWRLFEPFDYPAPVEEKPQEVKAVQIIEDRAYEALHRQFKLTAREENYSFKAFLERAASRHPDFPEP